MNQETKTRSSFSGKVGFVLAAAGSAVGLGNIWRFPYLAAKYGGGIFLFVYIILAVTFGFVLMITEIAIGRKTGLSAIEAYGAINKKFKFLGVLTSLVPIIILPYYSVIGGWVMKYLAVYIAGQGSEAAGAKFFGNFISEPIEPVLWFLFFIGLTAIVVLFGVQKGIEKVSRILMPVLVVLSVAVAVYSVTLPGAMEGVKYYLLPDFSKFSVNTVLGAMGQLFYSLSLAMGIMITYGSYMKRDVDLVQSARQIDIFDTGIAFIAGLMIIPAVFAFTGEAPQKAGPGLMFQALPQVFANMGFGTLAGILFFLLVLFAALTSSISLMETVVSIFQDKLGWERRGTCLIVLLGSIAIGIPSSLGFGPWSMVQIIGMDILDFFDFISNSVLMPIVALLTCICIGHIVGPKFVEDEVSLSGKFREKKMYGVTIRWIAPVCIVAILISSIMSALGIITI